MAPPIPFSLLQVLQRCHELEVLMGHVYMALARAHAANPRVAQLWKKTAKEEENHASQFSLAMSLGGDVMSQANVEVAELDRALESGRALQHEAEFGNIRPDEALRKAVELEEKMAKFHLHVAVTFRSPAHEKLFRAMMAADKGHIAALRAELDHLAGS